MRKKSPGGLPAKGRLADIADKLWSLAVKNDWGNKCAVCRKRGSLQSHHLVPRQHASLRYELRNGICLCTHCHQFDPDLSPHQNALGWTGWLADHHENVWAWYAFNRHPPKFEGTKTVEYYVGIIRSLRSFVEPKDFENIVGQKFTARLDEPQ